MVIVSIDVIDALMLHTRFQKGKNNVFEHAYQIKICIDWKFTSALKRR